METLLTLPPYLLMSTQFQVINCGEKRKTSTRGLGDIVLICHQILRAKIKKNVCNSSSFRMGLAISLVSDVKEKVKFVTC